MPGVLLVFAAFPLTSATSTRFEEEAERGRRRFTRMRKSEIDAFLRQMVLCTTSHHHVCFNYLLAICPTVVLSAPCEFSRSSLPKNVVMFSEFVLFRNKAKHSGCSRKYAGNKRKNARFPA